MFKTRYSIEGNIGAGKSYLLNLLRKVVHIINEPVDVWNTIMIDGKNILECFYSDMPKYAMSLQLTALITRFDNYMSCTEQVAVSERSLGSDKEIFARYFFDKQIIDEIQWEAYKYLNKILTDQLPPIEYLYLPTNPTKCLENIKKRGRVGEENISLDLLNDYDMYHKNAFGEHLFDQEKFFLDLEFKNPHFDKSSQDLRALSSTKKLIIFEGNIGSGKTRLLEKVDEMKLAGVKCVVEPVCVWQSIQDKCGKNILEYFYQDKNKYALVMQITALVSRFETLSKALQSDASVIIMERCLATDAQVFAKSLVDAGIISPSDWQIYTMWHKLFCDVCPISEIVYLTTPPKVCLDHVWKRSRSGEEHVKLELLEMYDEYHKRYIEQYPNVIKIEHEISLDEQIAQFLSNSLTLAEYNSTREL